MAEKSYHMKPQDLVVLFGILSYEEEGNWTQMQLSRDLNISQSEISECLKRLRYSGLMSVTSKMVDKQKLLNFLIHGLALVFPVKAAQDARGIATAHSALFMSDAIQSEVKYVWPYAKGDVRGYAIEPLYSSVPEAVQKNEKLYEFLVLADVLRVGRARERDVAMFHLQSLLDVQ